MTTPPSGQFLHADEPFFIPIKKMETGVTCILAVDDEPEPQTKPSFPEARRLVTSSEPRIVQVWTLLS
jgi:hypothetical protein